MDTNISRSDHVQRFYARGGRGWIFLRDRNGFLQLTDQGTVRFVEQYTGDVEFEAHPHDITEVEIAPRPVGHQLAGATCRNALLITLGDKRRIYVFDGRTHFISWGEAAVGVVKDLALSPIQSLAEDARELLDARGAGARSLEASEFWMNVLSGTTRLTT